MKKVLFAGTLLVAALQLYADFAADYGKACALRFKPKEAKVILEKLAGEKLEPAQRDQVFFDLADHCARLKDYEQARKYIDQITETHLKRYAHLRFLIQKPRAFQQIPTEFGNEDFSKWPEHLAYLGYLQRARAYYWLGKTEQALSDAQKCVENSGSDLVTRLSALSMAGTLSERLRNSSQALDYYRQVTAQTRFSGSSYYLQAALGAAAILCADKKYDEAQSILSRIAKTHRGYWQSQVYLAYGNLYLAQGKNPEAVKAYQQCLDEKNGDKAAQKKAAAALEKLSAGK